jgi:hypothetical protein
VADQLDHDRRRFLGRTAVTIAAARLGMLAGAEANDGVSRELAALGNATEWLNAPRLTPSMLAGKIVLANFCTYTCINWLRALPYVRAWAQKYRQGLVVIGVHTPEFEFEQQVDNVRRAVRAMGIDYPIVLDNDYAIWRAFDNHYWPALYLLDPKGRVRHHHFGEGEYAQSEKAIQRLLAESGVGNDGRVVSVTPTGVEAPADWGSLQSPENYLGHARTENFASREGVGRDRPRLYSAPARLALNQWALVGDWTMGTKATAGQSPGGRIVYRFHARDLHLVMGPPRHGASVRFRVTIDGQPPGAARGSEVDEGGSGIVTEQRMYQLLRQPKPIVDRRFDIEFLDPGVETFAFTFG